MRIVLDLQGAQAENRNRGIGRYTLALAQSIARHSGNHDVIVILNSAFPDSIEHIRNMFEDIIPPENIIVWNSLPRTGYLSEDRRWHRYNAELSREAFILSLKPDAVWISSLFEGLGDDAIATVHKLPSSVITAVTLYDLIPLIYEDLYLMNPAVKNWYMDRIENLKRADLLFGISQSATKEAIEYLSFPANKAVKVGTAANVQFLLPPSIPQNAVTCLKKYGLNKPFIMYTGGIDYRKNIEGLIRSYAALPKTLRKSHQLAIICSIQDGDRERLNSLAKKNGLKDGDVIFTGFVSDEEMVLIYQTCKLFVFPSFHEGFGLPVLEAMHCGAPVIAGNNSSLPEVVGWDEALFNAKDDKSITEKMQQALTDDLFRNKLASHGLEQVKKFSWDECGKRAIEALESAHNAQKKKQIQNKRKKSLAYISPLPPEKTGIADYSAELIPALAEHYDITLVVDQENVCPSLANEYPVRDKGWLENNFQEVDRILYHIGNSPFHAYIFKLLKTIPGTIVQHDFFVSQSINALRHVSPQNYANDCEEHMLHSHGYDALAKYKKDQQCLWNYPGNKLLLDQAQGVIVHARHARDLAAQWYGNQYAQDWAVIPLMREAVAPVNKSTLRKKYGYTDKDFIVCSFGFLGPTKRNMDLLDAWLSSPMAEKKDCHLVFVGENHPDDYGRLLLDKIENAKTAGEHIKITGWADMDMFRDYLGLADVGVQLRTMTRGETSAAVLDCMNYRLATIVNAHGSMAELPSDAVIMLDDMFKPEDLTDALTRLYKNPEERKKLGQKGQKIIRTLHAPNACARQYHDAIESFYAFGAANPAPLAKHMVEYAGRPDNENEWESIARLIVSNRHIARRYFDKPYLFVDVTDIMDVPDDKRDQSMLGAYEALRKTHNIEFVYKTEAGQYKNAHGYGLRITGLDKNLIEEQETFISANYQVLSPNEFQKQYSTISKNTKAA
ncbi:MAG: glycosyltransferase [Micavibrio sp.]